MKFLNWFLSEIDMSSDKNKLQEYFQKRNQPIPIYDTSRSGGEDHKPMWVSKVVVNDKEFTSEPRANKSAAEQDVARKALAFLENSEEVKEQPQETQPVHFIDPDLLNQVNWYERIILIDLENCPQTAKIADWPDNTLVIGIVGHCHALAQQNLPFRKSVIRSAMKDAADHAMTFLTGYIAHNIDATTSMYLVSRDHYAQVTAACLRELGIHAVHLPQLTASEVFSFR